MQFGQQLSDFIVESKLVDVSEKTFVEKLYMNEENMNIIGTATFTPKTWDEKPYKEMNTGRKLTRVQAVFTYSGDLAAEGTVDYLMAYNPDGTGSFVGLEHIVGSIGDQVGSFVTQHTGVFDPNSVTYQWEFVPGSGTDGLDGLLGAGDLRLEGPGPYPFSFNYQID